MENRRMGVIARIRTLTSLHREIDRDIRTECSRPLPDGARLQALKRTRLRLKDQIAAISIRLRTAGERRANEAA